MSRCAAVIAASRVSIELYFRRSNDGGTVEVAVPFLDLELLLTGRDINDRMCAMTVLVASPAADVMEFTASIW